MCRSIKTLFNYDPPATEAEIEAAAPPRSREAEAAKTKARSAKRFSP